MYRISTNLLEKIFTFSACITAIIYFAVLILYSLNMPLTDDYYDNLYFLLESSKAQGLSERFALLLWQYDEMHLLFNRIVYLTWHAVAGATDFRSLLLLANLLLPLLILLLWKTSGVLRQSTLHLLILCLFLFNMAQYQTAFWTMSALSNFSAMVFALGSFYLLSRPGWACFTTSAILAWLATFSMANGLLIFPLGILSILLQQRQHPDFIRLILWSSSAVLCIVLYFHGHATSAFTTAVPQQIAAYSWTGARTVVLTFFALVGGLPFDTTDTATAAILIGMVVTGMFGISVFWRKQLGIYLEDHLLVFLLFLLASLAVIAWFRAPMYGLETTAFTSRYKNLSCITIALIFIAFINCRAINTQQWLKYLLLGISLLSCAFSYYRFLPEQQKWHAIEKNGVSRWVLRGDQASLGLSGWYYLSHEILSEAVIAGMYKPFSTNAIHYQPSHIERIQQCNLSSLMPFDASIGVISKPEAIGARIIYHNTSSDITHILLCGTTDSYEMTIGNDDHRLDDVSNKHNVVFNKADVAIGAYQVYLRNKDNLITRGDKSLEITPYNPVYTCDESQFDNMPFRKVMVTNICRRYRQPR